MSEKPSIPFPFFNVQLDYSQSVVLLIGAMFGLRAIAASVLGLGVDESYAVVVSRTPSWSFYDHPPLGFMLARWSATVFGSEAAIVVRLPYLLLFAGSSWVLYRLTDFLFSARAGFWAVAWFSLAPFFFFSAGSWVVPDGPLIFFLLLAANIFARFLFAEGKEWGWIDWIGLGAVFGLALLSKYQAVLAGFGAFIFLLTTENGRRLCTKPGLYLAGIVSVLCFMPVVLWNAQNEWQSFAWQSGRAIPDKSFSALDGVLNAIFMTVGQMAYLLPGSFLVALWLIWLVLKSGPGDEKRWYCLWLGLPAIFIFNVLAPVIKTPLPHWTMPGFIFAFPLIGDFIDRTWPQGSEFLRRNFSFWLGLTTFLLVAGIFHVSTGFLTRAFTETPPKWDRTAEIMDWYDLRDAFATRGWLDGAKYVVVAKNWHQAAKIDYALGGRLAVLVLKPDRRHFVFLHNNTALHDRQVILTALAPLADGKSMTQILIALARRELCGSTPARPALLHRGGVPYRQFVIIKAHFRNTISSACTDIPAEIWHGFADKKNGNGFAGVGELSMYCWRKHRSVAIQANIPVGGKSGDPAKLVLVIDGVEHSLEQARLEFNKKEGFYLPRASLDSEHPVFKALENARSLKVVTDGGTLDVGLIDAAPLIINMIDACYGQFFGKTDHQRKR